MKSIDVFFSLKNHRNGIKFKLVLLYFETFDLFYEKNCYVLYLIPGTRIQINTSAERCIIFQKSTFALVENHNFVHLQFMLKL